jgi:hypothetical protein
MEEKESGEQLTYNEWESKHLAKHSELMKRYNELKEKEALLIEQKGGKTSKKVLLLDQQKNAIDLQIDRLKLDKIESDSAADKRYADNVNAIRVKRQLAIDEAENEYNRKLKKAEAEYRNTLTHYDGEKSASLNKNERIYNESKRILEQKSAGKEEEKAITTKTAAEVTLAANKIKILTELQSSINVMAMSRFGITNGKFITPLPTLPEPLPESAIIPRATPVSTATTEEILARLGEDGSAARARAEALQLDREKRREAHEQEVERQERILAHRRQMEREADERRAEREARERQERQQQPITPPLTQVQEEEEDDMTQEEIDAYIAQRKKERGGK